MHRLEEPRGHVEWQFYIWLNGKKNRRLLPTAPKDMMVSIEGSELSAARTFASFSADRSWSEPDRLAAKTLLEARQRLSTETFPGSG